MTTLRTGFSAILDSVSNIEHAARDIASLAKDKGQYISEETVSFVLRTQSNTEKRIYHILGAVEH